MSQPNNAIEKTLERWKKQTDALLDLNVILAHTSPLHRSTKGLEGRRRQLIEDLYVVRNGEDILLSPATLLWLFLRSSRHKNDLRYQVAKKGNWRNYLEELKIRHRLRLFGLTVSQFDRRKINALLEEG